MVINGGIVVFEMVLGLLIQSMALISDAIHNLSDIGAMILSYWAEKVARRPADHKKTYGYHKVEFIAAFVNSIAMSVAIGFILWESLGRLIAPPAVPGKEILWVALVAFFGNGTATLLLQKLSTHNFNLRSAWLHSLQDALLSLGVIAGAVLIMIFGWYIIDPLISLVICLFIIREIYKIVRHTVNCLLDAVPPGIDFLLVRDSLLAIDGVLEVRDLHIWQTGSHHTLLSAHIRANEGCANGEGIIRFAQQMLLEQYGINHTTLQVIPFSAVDLKLCSHCN